METISLVFIMCLSILVNIWAANKLVKTKKKSIKIELIAGNLILGYDIYTPGTGDKDLSINGDTIIRLSTNES